MVSRECKVEAVGTASGGARRGEIMQKAIPLAAAAAALLATCGCTKTAHSATDAAGIVNAIKAQDAQWAKDYAAGNVDAINAHYTSSGALAGPGYLATTSNERRDVLSAFMSDPHFTQTFSSDHVDVSPSGDFAASRGRFLVTMTDPTTKQPADYEGAYLTVYQKEADGSWKAIDRFLTVGAVPAAELGEDEVKMPSQRPQ